MSLMVTSAPDELASPNAAPDELASPDALAAKGSSELASTGLLLMRNASLLLVICTLLCPGAHECRNLPEQFLEVTKSFLPGASASSVEECVVGMWGKVLS